MHPNDTNKIIYSDNSDFNSGNSGRPIMHPKGTIYHSGKHGEYGGANVVLTKMERFAYRLLRTIGAGLIATGVVSALLVYGPVVKEEIYYRIYGQEREVKRSKFSELIDIAEADRIARVQKEAESFGVDSHFALVIPKINAASNIVANVDPTDEDEYLEALSQGVAHARGTYFPSQGKNIYLFSHSTDSLINVNRYNAVFYLLRKLEEKDKITVYFSDKRYDYQVEKVVTTSKDDTSWLTEVKESETLILQTCDPPGTTWKRLLVIARPVS